MQKPEDIDTADDLDELTESSDTATDDMDSPTSGYRHASLLMQRLTSSTFDSTSITKLQNIFHEYERAIEKVKSRHGYLEEKVSHLEMEREALKGSLEEVKDAKSLLERNQLELQTQVTNLKFQLKQEQENRHNATMMYNATRDKLRRLEEQHQMEVQEKQKVELTLRNVELDMRTLISNLEEEHAETQRLLAQERSTRALQENLLNSHLRKQQEMEVENKRIISSSSEVIPVDDLQGQLEKETSHRNQLEKINEELKDQVASLKGLGRSHDEQERSKRLLEEEVLELRRRLEANQIQREQHRREMEEKAQRDLKDKLEQVNLFLQSQAASQEQLDQLKAANEANLRTQLEQRIQKLEAELGRARSGQLESLNQRESELERYRQLYNEEMRQRKSLAAKLDRLKLSSHFIQFSLFLLHQFTHVKANLLLCTCLASRW
uniref:CCDC144C-like coiled-coil domain-containing protein n=1 Tax=Cyprinodon variegatus TaxID=28743 RepID=A0A3Q2DBA1_CYPVA